MEVGKYSFIIKNLIKKIYNGYWCEATEFQSTATCEPRLKSWNKWVVSLSTNEVAHSA